MKSILEHLREQRATTYAPAKAVIDLAENEDRDLTDTELVEVRDLSARLAPIDVRIAELVDLETRNAAAEHIPTVRVKSEPMTYSEHSPTSYVRDMILAQTRNDPDAWSRLHRHAAEVNVERRDITRVDGAGGEFVPPLWLIDAFVDVARPGRVIADLVSSMPLPGGTDSINIPKVSTSPAVAAQTADNAAVQETDEVTTSVAMPVRTIAGQQDVAIQLIEQSPLAGGIDRLIFGQLAADYERYLGTQLWNGSGASGQVTGILGTSGIGAVTYTDASPTVPELYLPLAQAVNSVHTLAFKPATAIVMHPRRWNWMTSALDTSNRPLVVPTANGPYMAIGVKEGLAAQGGPVGSVLGLPVYLDATMPINLGAGTNEDRIVVAYLPDAWLMEGALRTRVLPDVLSANLTVRFQLYRYVAFTAARLPVAFAAISGTGLVTVSGF